MLMDLRDARLKLIPCVQHIESDMVTRADRLWSNVSGDSERVNDRMVRRPRESKSIFEGE